MNKITDDTLYRPLLAVIIGGGGGSGGNDEFPKSLGREVYVGGGGRSNNRCVSGSAGAE